MPDTDDADFVRLVEMMQVKQLEVDRLQEQVELLQRDLIIRVKERDLYRSFHEANLAKARLPVTPIPPMVLSSEEQAAFNARIQAARDNAQKWRNALEGLKKSAMGGLRTFLASQGPGV